MNTAQVASALNTEPKILRRFLRADSNYANAGAGGRYVFTDDDLPTMREHFLAWLGEKAAKAPAKPRIKDVAPADDIAAQRLPRRILGRKLYASERTRREAIGAARAERLDQMLLAAGLHITQVKERVR
jgi:hypothetical protein